jgi:hypothetical protein
MKRTHLLLAFAFLCLIMGILLLFMAYEFSKTNHVAGQYCAMLAFVAFVYSAVSFFFNRK